MSSTTSKRLLRVWSIIDGAHETGAGSVSISYLTAAMVGGEKWAKLEAIAAQAPLSPEEYRAFLEGDALLDLDPPALTPAEYDAWYDQEMDRLSAETDRVLSTPDVVV